MTARDSSFPANYHISVTGVMGSGKTTASNLLAERLGFHLFEENVEGNTFLPLFYEDPKRWALPMQLFYLREKVAQLMKIRNLLDRTSVVHDSPIYQDYYTYVKAQQILGNITGEELVLYEKFFHMFHDRFPVPHLIIHLKAEPQVLLQRIRERARDYEKNVDIPYLELLTRLQQEWVSQSPHLHIISVDVGEVNFARDEAGKREFIETVRKGLEALPVRAYAVHEV